MSVKMVIAKQMDTQATLKQVIAAQLMATTSLTEAAAIEVVNAALTKTLIIMGLLTVGTIGLTAGIAALVSGMAIDKQLKKSNTQLEEMRELMTAPSSPPLYESFRIMGDNVDYLTRRLKGINSIAKSSRLGSLGTSGKGPTSVTITGNTFVVRSDRDVDRIGDVLMRRISNRGA